MFGNKTRNKNIEELAERKAQLEREIDDLRTEDRIEQEKRTRDVRTANQEIG